MSDSTNENPYLAPESRSKPGDLHPVTPSPSQSIGEPIYFSGTLTYEMLYKVDVIRQKTLNKKRNKKKPAHYLKIILWIFGVGVIGICAGLILPSASNTPDDGRSESALITLITYSWPILVFLTLVLIALPILIKRRLRRVDKDPEYGGLTLDYVLTDEGVELRSEIANTYFPWSSFSYHISTEKMLSLHLKLNVMQVVCFLQSWMSEVTWERVQRVVRQRVAQPMDEKVLTESGRAFFLPQHIASETGQASKKPTKPHFQFTGSMNNAQIKKSLDVLRQFKIQRMIVNFSHKYYVLGCTIPCLIIGYLLQPLDPALIYCLPAFSMLVAFILYQVEKSQIKTYMFAEKTPVIYEIDEQGFKVKSPDYYREIDWHEQLTYIELEDLILIHSHNYWYLGLVKSWLPETSRNEIVEMIRSRLKKTN